MDDNNLILVKGVWGAMIPEDVGVVTGMQTEAPGIGCHRIRWITRGNVVELVDKIRTPGECRGNGSPIGVWHLKPGTMGYNMALKLLIDGFDEMEECHENPTYHGKALVDVLTELKRRGLEYAAIPKVFGVPRDENPYAAFAQKHLATDELEFDDHVLLSETDHGCWVSCWSFISDEDAGVNHALALVIDLDERGIFKAHVENHLGNTIFELSNEDDRGNPCSDGLWLVRDGYMKHGRDAEGLLTYLQDMGVATEKNTLAISG
ncbi:hypothetical protein HAP94_04470 [Acidithiobacillus ferrivorans]|nr:hypothetical protein [Acidithiobacillus ferrivorans]